MVIIQKAGFSVTVRDKRIESLKYYLISALLIEAVSEGCCDSHQVHQGQELLEVAISQKIKTALNKAGLGCSNGKWF